METNPNVNCLAGMQCPRCRAYAPFEISSRAVVRYYDDGSDLDKSPLDFEWDDDSTCSCAQCGFFGEVKDFREWGPRYTTHQLERGGEYIGRHGLYDLYFLPEAVTGDVGRYICRMGNGKSDLAMFCVDYVDANIVDAVNTRNDAASLFLELKLRKEWLGY